MLDEKLLYVYWPIRIGCLKCLLNERKGSEFNQKGSESNNFLQYARFSHRDQSAKPILGDPMIGVSNKESWIIKGAASEPSLSLISLHLIHETSNRIWNRLDCRFVLLYISEIMSIPSHITYAIVLLTSFFEETWKALTRSQKSYFSVDTAFHALDELTLPDGYHTTIKRK